MAVQNDRGPILKVKRILGEKRWRSFVKLASPILRAAPVGIKYGIGLAQRRSRFPYKVIEPNDVVVQIGCPRDLLAAGRSRSVYFLKLVSGTGKLVVMEPDTENCRAITEFAEKQGLSDRIIVVPAGGWDKDAELSFFASAEHPASAVLVDLNKASADDMKRRGYNETKVPVTTVDKVLKDHGLPVPKLVSSTTNGAEIQIISGMQETLKEGPAYISLALTGKDYQQAVDKLDYDYIADDDRGFTFKRR